MEAKGKKTFKVGGVEGEKENLEYSQGKVMNPI